MADKNECTPAFRSKPKQIALIAVPKLRQDDRGRKMVEPVPSIAVVTRKETGMRYFFNVKSEAFDEIDKEGSDFPDVAAAHQEAVRSAREMVAELVLNDDRIDGMRYEIADEANEVVATVWFRDVLKLD